VSFVQSSPNPLPTPPTLPYPAAYSTANTPCGSTPSEARRPFPHLVDALCAEYSARLTTPAAEAASQPATSQPYLPFLQPSYATFLSTSPSGSTPTLQHGGFSLTASNSTEATTNSMQTQRSAAINQAALCGMPRGPQGDSFDTMRASCLFENLAARSSACTETKPAVTGGVPSQRWTKLLSWPALAAANNQVPPDAIGSLGKQRPLILRRFSNPLPVALPAAAAAVDVRTGATVSCGATPRDGVESPPPSAHLAPWQQEELADQSTASLATNPTAASLSGGTTAPFVSESEPPPSDPFLMGSPGEASPRNLFSEASSLTSPVSVPQQCSARLRGGSDPLELPPWAVCALDTSPQQPPVRLRDFSTAIAVPPESPSSSHSSSGQTPPQLQEAASAGSLQECSEAMSVVLERRLCGTPVAEESCGRDSISLWTPVVDKIETHYRTFGNPLSWQLGALQGADAGCAGSSVHALLERFADMSAHLHMWRGLRSSADGVQVYSGGCAFI
jgi:hypothetical protein